MALILEIRDPRGMLSWHRLDTLPLTIGRALTNDIILDDPYLDARHARITRGPDGEVVIDDLGTVNGLVVDRQRVSNTVHVVAGQELRAGRTTLRFRDADEEVPPALRDESAPSPKRVDAPASRTGPDVRRPIAGAAWLAWLVATRARRVACCLVMLGAFACNAWLSDTSRSSGSTVFGAVLGFAALAGVWAALWAAAGRAVTQRFELLAHAAVVSLAMTAMLAWGTVNEWLTFLFPDAKIAWLLYLLVFLIVLATLVAAHLSLATALPWRRQRRTGLFVAAGVVLLLVVAGLVSEDKFTDVPKFANQLKPMSARVVPARPVSEFGAVARELRDEVDTDAKKPVTP